jgi:hypothetical protein
MPFDQRTEEDYEADLNFGFVFEEIKHTSESHRVHKVRLFTQQLATPANFDYLYNDFLNENPLTYYHKMKYPRSHFQVFRVPISVHTEAHAST